MEQRKLYLLSPINEDGWPWTPWYDKAFGFVVRADSEAEARLLATKGGGDEIRATNKAWLDPQLSSCVELTADGPIEVIMRDYRQA